MSELKIKTLWVLCVLFIYFGLLPPQKTVFSREKLLLKLFCVDETQKLSLYLEIESKKNRITSYVVNVIYCWLKSLHCISGYCFVSMCICTCVCVCSFANLAEPSGIKHGVFLASPASPWKVQVAHLEAAICHTVWLPINGLPCTSILFSQKSWQRTQDPARRTSCGPRHARPCCS